MIEHDYPPHITENEETYSLLSELHNSSESTQRELSDKLGMSLGKVNYLLKELVKRGFVSIHSFSANPQKIKKLQYVLTKKGFQARVDLTRHFLKKKEAEYKRMKAAWDELQSIELCDGIE